MPKAAAGLTNGTFFSMRTSTTAQILAGLAGQKSEPNESWGI